MNSLRLNGNDLRLRPLSDFVFGRRGGSIDLPPETKDRVQRSHERLLSLIERGLPIYGVTTGFGDSVSRAVNPAHAEDLQRNLISYLLCGSGPALSRDASRAIFAIRVNSMCRGYSGISVELLERMKLYLENDWIPVIPREGSLGASGDLIPLAYLAQILQGEGKIHGDGGPVSMSVVLREQGLAPYRLKAKEGLALVNGTSAMAGLAVVNLNHARFLLETLSIASGWLVLALQGRDEAFNELVNEKSKASRGQGLIARRIRELLKDENYRPKPFSEIGVSGHRTQDLIQDRYSVRCVPQILGPVEETLQLVSGWIEDEINGTSDNPLIGDDGSLATGGNFYGGYMSQGMDYLKISLAHMADLLDRQLMTVIDEKSNRGLPANLADWGSLPEDERHLHHGLKGLHQAVNAITSEILPKALPGGIFSRSSESHNQDKVSLGMSAAVQCGEMIEPLFTITAMHLTVLAQALDLRGIKLQGSTSREVYDLVRGVLPFVARDKSLGDAIDSLRTQLKSQSERRGGWFKENT